MSSRTENETLIDGFKRLPKYPMRTDSKGRILQELHRLEEEDMPSHTLARATHSRRRVISGALAGVAGILLLGTVGELAYNRVGLETTAARASSKTTETATNGSKPTAFAMSLPFSPKVPVRVVRGYKLTDVEAFTQLAHGRTVFNGYFVQYSKGSGMHLALLHIFEAPSNSVKIWKNNGLGIPARGNELHKLAQSNGITYFEAKNNDGDTVAFERNHVAYFLNSMNLSSHELLTMAANLSKTAAVQYAQRTSVTKKDVLANISFRPFVPKTVEGKYSLVSESSEINTRGNAVTFQTVNLTYQRSRQQALYIFEAPLNESGTLFQPIPNSYGRAYIWKDKKRGIGFLVERIDNTSQADFLKGAKAFQRLERASWGGN